MNKLAKGAAIAFLLIVAAIFSNQYAKSQGFVCCFKPPTCAAADTYLARTTEGALTAGRLRTMICGMVTDGVGCSAWSGSTGNMDILYDFSQDNQTDALLNLCSTSFNLTINGSVTFTANSNFTSDNTTGYLATGFTPSTAGGNFLSTLAHLGAYVLSTAVTGSNLMGCSQAAVTNSYLVPTTSGAAFFSANASAAISPTAPGVSGLSIATKTSGTVSAMYKNGNTTPLATANPGTNTNCSNQMLILARNANGTPSFGTSAAPVAVAFAGGALTATQQNLISNRINALMTAQGINVY